MDAPSEARQFIMVFMAAKPPHLWLLWYYGGAAASFYLLWYLWRRSRLILMILFIMVFMAAQPPYL